MSSGFSWPGAMSSGLDDFKTVNVMFFTSFRLGLPVQTSGLGQPGGARPKGRKEALRDHGPPPFGFRSLLCHHSRFSRPRHGGRCPTLWITGYPQGGALAPVTQDAGSLMVHGWMPSPLSSNVLALCFH